VAATHVEERAGASRDPTTMHDLEAALHVKEQDRASRDLAVAQDLEVATRLLLSGSGGGGRI
jgi:hypothetical protein